MPPIIFDSSVLLALVQNETGAVNAREYLDASHMSAVNYAEVVSVLSHEGFDGAQIDIILNGMTPTLEVFDAAQARRAGFLRSSTRHLGLSLGDRACLALAQHMRLPVLTADRAWLKLDVGVEVRVIR